MGVKWELETCRIRMYRHGAEVAVFLESAAEIKYEM